MAIYHEFPKNAVIPTLMKKFTSEEIELVRDDAFKLLHECHTMEEFENQLYLLIQKRKADTGNHAENFKKYRYRGTR
jgi:hypothetical protein